MMVIVHRMADLVSKKYGLWLAVGAICNLLLAVHPARADKVSVQGTARDGTGRITFNWPSPVPYVAKIQGRQLIIQFARPVEANFTSAARRLNKFIGRPTLRNGGLIVSFPLKGTFDLNYFARGRTVIVDIVDPNPTAAPEKVPAVKTAAKTPPTAKATPAPSPTSAPSSTRTSENVGVRAGVHPNYDRVVFDWRKSVPYKVDKKGNRTTITFDRPANVNVSTLNNRRLSNFRGAGAQVGGKQTVVTLSVPSSSRVKHFRSGSKVVVDVLNPTGANDAPPVQKLLAESAPTAKKTTAASKSAKPVSLTPQKAGAKQKGGSAKDAAAKVKPQGKSTPKDAKSAAQEPATVEADVDPKDVKAVTLRIDWTSPTAAAVFRRAGNLWLVFDRKQTIDVRKLQQSAGTAVRKIEQIPSDHATILRFATVSGINPSLKRDGLAWIFDFKQQPLQPQVEIETKSQPNSPVGARLFISVAGSGEPVPFKDVEVGDNLVVIPVIPLGHGLPKKYRYPQVQILPTAQGIVVKPSIDNLRVRAIQQGVELTSASKLALTSLLPKVSARAKPGSIRSLSRIFKLNTWRQARRMKISDFRKVRQKMLNRLSLSQGAERQKERMKYAIFLFANHFGYEAIGVLRSIESENPDIITNKQFRLLKGATNFTIGRYEDALKDLDHGSMDDNDEGEFWRAAALAGSGKLVEAAAVLSKKGSVFRPYPRAIKIPLGLLVTDAAIAAGDIKTGIKYLEMLAEEDPTPKEIDQLALLEGKLKKLSGDFDGAIAAWEEVEQGEHRPSMADAIVLRTDLSLELKQIKAKEAIEELEGLRFSWRGGEFEFNLLRRLGRLYLDIGDYGNGLRTLQAAASYFKGNPNAGEVTQEMASAFANLYLNDAADSMPPVRAIALFDEFKELTPSSKTGDEMIRKLADRLAAVDLLGRAAKLLEHQVKFRLKGVEKARVGARLAAVQLLNREPKAAQIALNSSKESGLLPDLEVQRRHLTARALIDLMRQAEAIVLLEDDESREAELLRAEVFWASQTWPLAAKALQKLVTMSGAVPGKPLSEKQSQYVLNYAIAIALAGNERGVVRLKNDYSKAMVAGPFKDAFQLIASPNSIGLIDYRTVAAKVKTVSNFKNFMAAYKDRLKEGNLSSLN